MKIFLFILIVTSINMQPQSPQKKVNAQEHSYRPERGFVPDQVTAIAIAEAVWLPIYGKDTLAKERPFKAILNGDVWKVTGTFHWVTKQDKGGVALAEISREDGRIIRVSHGM